MAMSVSLKKDTKKTNIKHNNRKMSDKEKERNDHINFSYSHENNYLVQESLKVLYKKEFGEAQEKYNENQKRKDRKIEDYYEHVQKGKKTSLQQEMILQVGDKDDFNNNVKNIRLANDVLVKWFYDFEKRNPNLKVYNAVIHNDEASPHLHLNFVPVATGYKRGMEKQVSFDRAILQQDKTLNKSRPFEDWRNKEIELLTELLNEHGIDRKLVGTNQYKDVNEFKEKKDELRELEQSIQERKEDLGESIKSVLEFRMKSAAELKKFEKIQTLNENQEKRTGIEPITVAKMPVVEIKKKMFGGIEIDPEQVEELKAWAKSRNEIIKEQGKDLKVKDTRITQLLEVVKTQNSEVEERIDAGMVSERHRMDSEHKSNLLYMQRLENDLQASGERVKALENENEELISKLSRVLKVNNYLQETLETIKRNSLQHLEVAIDKIQIFIGNARMFALRKEFGDKAMNEKNIENAIPSEEREGAERYLKFYKEQQAEKEPEKSTKRIEKDDFEMDR